MQKRTVSPTALRAGLAVLTLINLFNYLDRYIVSALVETLKHSELALSDAQAGLLMTGFIVVYMLASPLFGILGDRYSRPKLIAGGVAIWSLATAAAGLTASFGAMFTARAAVGIGEAAYGTIAPALLADYFPARMRGRIFAIFFSAIPIGSALGYVLGGLMNQHYGWRAAFFVAGLPGLVLAATTLFLCDPPRGSQDEMTSPRAAQDEIAPSRAAQGDEAPTPAPVPARANGLRDYFELRKNGMYAGTVLGYAAYTFGLGGLAFWMPAFLERVRGMPAQQASVNFGAVVVVTGFLGTFIGGWLGDRLARRWSQAYLWVSGASALAAAPFAAIALMTPNLTTLWVTIIIAELLLFASTGPINSAILGFVSPGARAMAMAACNFTIHILGDVPSPPLIGWLSDRGGLASAVLIVPVSVAACGVIWLLCAKAGERPA